MFWFLFWEAHVIHETWQYYLTPDSELSLTKTPGKIRVTAPPSRPKKELQGTCQCHETVCNNHFDLSARAEDWVFLLCTAYFNYLMYASWYSMNHSSYSVITGTMIEFHWTGVLTGKITQYSSSLMHLTVLQTQCDFIDTAYRQRFNSLSTPDQRSEAQPNSVHREKKKKLAAHTANMEN